MKRMFTWAAALVILIGGILAAPSSAGRDDDTEKGTLDILVQDQHQRPIGNLRVILAKERQEVRKRPSPGQEQEKQQKLQTVAYLKTNAEGRCSTRQPYGAYVVAIQYRNEEILHPVPLLQKQKDVVITVGEQEKAPEDKPDKQK